MSLDLQVAFYLWQESAHCNISFAFCPPFFLYLSIFKEGFLYFFQVLINGLDHFVPIDVKPKLQIVEAFIKVSISWLNFINELQIMMRNFWSDVVIENCCLTYLTRMLHSSNSEKSLSFSLFNTGILPTWNWICTLGTGSPSKFYPYRKWEISPISYLIVWLFCITYMRYTFFLAGIQ